VKESDFTAILFLYWLTFSDEHIRKRGSEQKEEKEPTYPRIAARRRSE